MASLSDKLTDTRNAARPNSARATGTRSTGGTSLACDNLAGWPTASKVHFVTYQIDSNSNPVSGTQLDCYGIVSGNTIGSFTVIDGSDTGNSVGDVVEMLPTAAWGQDLADALTAEHSRTGTHTAAAVATMKTAILGAVYPVGSLYINKTVATNPTSLLGFGTWTAITDTMIMAVGSTYTANTTGGAATHTHPLSSAGQAAITSEAAGIYVKRTAPGFTATRLGATTSDTNSGATPSTSAALQGNTDSGSSLPPYTTAYIWQRTA